MRAVPITILGAGFGGLELTALLSEALGDSAEITLIDKNESFVFGFSKLDLMFGRKSASAIRVPYDSIVKPGVRFVQQSIVAFDPESRRVTTTSEEFDADYLVVALGADYDLAATPGLEECGNEFYSVDGAERLRDVLGNFNRGRAIVGVCGAPFKCPPAPSEAALLLHDYLVGRGVRDDCEISIVLPFKTPVPPSPETSIALESAFLERDINFVAGCRVSSLDPARKIAILDEGTELPFDLFLGVPKHCAPDVVVASGMTQEGWVPANPRTLETRFPGVYAVGDVVSIGVPKAGVFAEGQARIVANELVARIHGSGQTDRYSGKGSCYVEFGGGRVGRVDVDFFSGPSPTGTFQAPSASLLVEKDHFGSSRRARWFDA